MSTSTTDDKRKQKYTNIVRIKKKVGNGFCLNLSNIYINCKKYIKNIKYLDYQENKNHF